MIIAGISHPSETGAMGGRNGTNAGISIDQTEVRFLVEKNADGIIVVDEDGIVLFANPAAEHIFGRPLRSLIGSPIGIPLIAGDTPEIAIHKPGGEHIDAEIRVVETVWNHRPARLASLRDVSARRAMEERLRHAARMEAVGRLTAGIAHEFNNLLTVVLGNLESVQRRAALAEPALLQGLRNATRGAQRAARLTERLLTFARRKPLDPKVTDINALISGMSDLLQRTLGEEIRVRTMLATDLWPAEVDPTELEAAILNLAVNARDAMPSGGELLIETGNAPLDGNPPEREEVKAGAYVLISVSDSGIGMAPEVLKQAFEPFFTTKGAGGTGLGLSQVYGFIRQSGGYVTLSSKLGAGTTARLYLPKAEEASRVAYSATADWAVIREIPRSKSGECILVVEDDDDVRKYTVGSLRELGYLVFEAADAASALETVAHAPNIHLILTDLGLAGGVDGRVLGERVRAIRPSTRVLITTAYAASALIHDGRLDAGVDLLNKPFTFAELATRIRDVLDRDCDERRATCILVVEDEPLLRGLVVEALGDLGCEVEEAGNFRQALDKFQRIGDSLAAAIIDLGLPDRPGDELVSQLRAARPKLPILVTTGYATEAMCERLPEDTLLRILDKPFELARLRDALERFGIRFARP